MTGVLPQIGFLAANPPHDRVVILSGHTAEVTNSGESARGIEVSAGGALDLLGGGLSVQGEGSRLATDPWASSSIRRVY